MEQNELKIFSYLAFIGAAIALIGLIYMIFTGGYGWGNIITTLIASALFGYVGYRLR